MGLSQGEKGKMNFPLRLRGNLEGFRRRSEGVIRDKTHRAFGKGYFKEEFREGTCYGLVHPKLWTNSNTRPTQKHKHSPTNKSK
jgi:hypothetical protein